MEVGGLANQTSFPLVCLSLGLLEDMYECLQEVGKCIQGERIGNMNHITADSAYHAWSATFEVIDHVSV